MFEIHTSDFDPCPARAKLRRDGRFDGVAGTALVRGISIHNALETLHNSPEESAVAAVADGVAKCMAELEEQGRSPSDAVLNNTSALSKELAEAAVRYREQVMPICENWTLLGTEVPVYYQLRDDVHLSSHIDILFVDSDGRARAWDWKWRVQAPSAFSDLARHLQLACYWAALADGGLVQTTLRAKGWIQEGDNWCRVPEGSALPELSWVDLPSLKPYARATLGKDSSGKAVQYKKGDCRPIDRIIRTPQFHLNQLDAIKEAALLRADLIINDMAPFIPQGCSHCECEPWCPRFDIAENKLYNDVKVDF